MTTNRKLIVGGLPLLAFSFAVIAAAYYIFSPKNDSQNLQHTPKPENIKDTIQFVSIRYDSLIALIKNYQPDFTSGSVERKRIKIRLKNIANIPNNGFNLRNSQLEKESRDTGALFFITKKENDILVAFEISRQQPLCVKVPTDILLTLFEKHPDLTKQ